MKTLLTGTALTLMIATISSAAYAKEPVPPAGTTGESVNRRLEVIQQHGGQQQELPIPQGSSSPQSQTTSNLTERRSTTESTPATCLLKPVTAGGMAQRAFAIVRDCKTQS